MGNSFSIIASVLGADFSRLGEECSALESAGIDAIQWDVMDGQFVPNLTMGPDVISSVRPHTKIFFEAHLMTLTPEVLAKNYVEAGCERIIIHLEACPDIKKSLTAIKALGVEVGIALNPETPANVLTEVLDDIDMVLVMTVNPGWGGQAFLEDMVAKIAEVRKMLDATGRKLDLEVDGGIGNKTVSKVAEAGANLLVSGSALYKHKDGLASAISELRSLAIQAAESTN